jgi:hypothetical protein
MTSYNTVGEGCYTLPDLSFFKMVKTEAIVTKLGVTPLHLRGCRCQIGVGHRRVEHLRPFTWPDLSRTWALSSSATCSCR